MADGDSIVNGSPGPQPCKARTRLQRLVIGRKASPRTSTSSASTAARTPPCRSMSSGSAGAWSMRPCACWLSSRWSMKAWVSRSWTPRTTCRRKVRTTLTRSLHRRVQGGLGSLQLNQKVRTVRLSSTPPPADLPESRIRSAGHIDGNAARIRRGRGLGAGRLVLKPSSIARWAARVAPAMIAAASRRRGR